MSTGSTRIKLLLLGIGLVALAVAAGILTADQTVPSATGQRSTYNAGPTGLRALYQVLEKTREEPPMRLKSIRSLSGQSGVLVVVGPLEQELTPEEADLIWGWVRRGNGLLYVVGMEAPDRAPSALDERVLEGEMPELMPASYPRFTRQALSHAITPAFQYAPMILTSKPLQPGPPLPLAGSLLYSSGQGPTVTWMAVQDGNVLICARSTLAQNRHIDQLYNLDFLLSALDFLRPEDGRIIFDELHHGFPERPQVLGLLTLRGILAAAVQILACALLYVLVQGRRQGPPADPETPPRRGISHYLDAAGSLYRRNCDPGQIVAAYAESVAHEASRHRGLSGPLEPGRLAPVLARRSPLGSEQVQALLQKAQDAAETGLSAKEATEMIRQLNELIQTVRPAGPLRLQEKNNRQMP